MESELSGPPTCLPGATSGQKKEDSMQLIMTCASHTLSSTTSPADNEVCIAEPAFKRYSMDFSNHNEINIRSILFHRIVKVKAVVA